MLALSICLIKSGRCSPLDPTVILNAVTFVSLATGAQLLLVFSVGSATCRNATSVGSGLVEINVVLCSLISAILVLLCLLEMAILASLLTSPGNVSTLFPLCKLTLLGCLSHLFSCHRLLLFYQMVLLGYLKFPVSPASMLSSSFCFVRRYTLLG